VSSGKLIEKTAFLRIEGQRSHLATDKIRVSSAVQAGLVDADLARVYIRQMRISTIGVLLSVASILPEAQAQTHVKY
jgi:hypothetical protein